MLSCLLLLASQVDECSTFLGLENTVLTRICRLCTRNYVFQPLVWKLIDLSLLVVSRWHSDKNRGKRCPCVWLEVTTCNMGFHWFFLYVRIAHGEGAKVECVHWKSMQKPW